MKCCSDIGPRPGRQQSSDPSSWNIRFIYIKEMDKIKMIVLVICPIFLRPGNSFFQMFAHLERWIWWCFGGLWSVGSPSMVWVCVSIWNFLVYTILSEGGCMSYFTYILLFFCSFHVVALFPNRLWRYDMICNIQWRYRSAISRFILGLVVGIVSVYGWMGGSICYRHR